jgi:aminoglycoside/choline kinase family phosphotransferase
VTPSAPFPLQPLEELLESATGTRPPLDFEEIVGGASVRRFFRAKTRSGGRAIAMYVPAQSHEIAKPSIQQRPWPFLEVRSLLEAFGIRVPALLGTDCDRGFVLVEDLGETLAQHLEHTPSDREELYRIAVRELSKAQRRLFPLPTGSIVLERAFDEELLLREVEHFREWALEARGIHLSGPDRAIFDRAAHYLADTIASWPRGFVHRDYQSRNLMVVRDGAGQLGLGWIDFQDAMLGPRVYDMVALLSDSYQTFSRDFVEARLDDFTRYLELSPEDRALIGREFRLVTVQRKLKDAGRFIFIERTHNNPAFLPFVAGSIQKAQAALDELADAPSLAELAGLLERLFPR